MIRSSAYVDSYQPHDGLFANDPLARRLSVFLIAQGAAAAGVRLSVDAGRVTLRGLVPTRRASALIETCCRRVAGVLSVANQLVVAEAFSDRSRSTESAGGRLVKTTTSRERRKIEAAELTEVALAELA